jgi:hypothetical protein
MLKLSAVLTNELKRTHLGKAVDGLRVRQRTKRQGQKTALCTRYCWYGHVKGTECYMHWEGENAYTILVGKPYGKRLLEVDRGIILS